MKNYLKQYLFLVKDYRHKLWLFVVLFLFSAALDFVGIGLIGPFVGLALRRDNAATEQYYAWMNAYLGYDSNDVIIFIGLIVILAFTIKGVAAFIIQRKIILFAAGVEKDIKINLLERYFKGRYDSHKNKDSAKQVNLISNYSRMFANDTLMQSLRLVSDSIVILAILILLFNTSVIYTGCLIGIFSCLFGVYDIFVKKRIIKYGKEVAVISEKVISIVRDSVLGKQELMVYKKEKLIVKVLGDNVKDYANSLSAYMSLKVAPRYGMEVLMVLFVIGIIIISISTQQNLEGIFSVLSIFAVSAVRIIPTANQMIVSVNSMRFSKYVLNELYTESILGIEATLNNGLNCSGIGDNKNAPKFKSIELKNVSFSYDNNKYILKNINIKINHGERFFIEGKSGVGKSTLVKIILGLLKPSEGEVYLNGNLIDHNDNDRLNHFAYIPQKLMLMNDSIKNNILFGEELTDKNRSLFIDSLEKSGLFETMSSFSDGIETIIGEVGSRLSGGQGQRIGLARAFFHDREVLIFDEATSSLDKDTESKVLDTLRLEQEDRTYILISHNPEIGNLCQKKIHLL